MKECHTVLLVEDDELLSDMLGEVLADAGFLVVTASAVQEALDIASSNNVDLVLTDLNLHGSTGLELLQHLSERSPALPTVLMSAFLDDESEKRARQLGARAALSKPFRNHEMLAAVQQAIAQSDAECADR